MSRPCGAAAADEKMFADNAEQIGYVRVEGHPAYLSRIITAANGFTGERAAQIITDGHADRVALGRMFNPNSDLPDHLRDQRPLTPYDCSTFFGGDGRG